MNHGVLPQRPEFEVTVCSEGGVRVVTVSGELDLDTMGELNAVLADDEGLVATTVIDLRRLTFIDSSGLRAPAFVSPGRQMSIPRRGAPFP